MTMPSATGSVSQGSREHLPVTFSTQGHMDFIVMPELMSGSHLEVLQVVRPGQRERIIFSGQQHPDFFISNEFTQEKPGASETYLILLKVVNPNSNTLYQLRKVTRESSTNGHLPYTITKGDELLLELIDIEGSLFAKPTEKKLRLSVFDASDLPLYAKMKGKKQINTDNGEEFGSGEDARSNLFCLGYSGDDPVYLHNAWGSNKIDHPIPQTLGGERLVSKFVEIDQDRLRRLQAESIEMDSNTGQGMQRAFPLFWQSVMDPSQLNIIRELEQNVFLGEATTISISWRQNATNNTSVHLSHRLPVLFRNNQISTQPFPANYLDDPEFALANAKMLAGVNQELERSFVFAQACRPVLLDKYNSPYYNPEAPRNTRDWFSGKVVFQRRTN